jgi:hypothetical protein
MLARGWIVAGVAIAILGAAAVLVLIKRSQANSSAEPQIRSIAVLPFKPFVPANRDEAPGQSFRRRSSCPATPLMCWRCCTASERSGNHIEALKIVAKLNELLKEHRAQPQDLAIIYAGIGDRDHAFEWLEKAYEERSGLLLYLKTDPFFDPLRSDPRFADLLLRVGLPSYESSKIPSLRSVRN